MHPSPVGACIARPPVSPVGADSISARPARGVHATLSRKKKTPPAAAFSFCGHAQVITITWPFSTLASHSAAEPLTVTVTVASVQP